MSTRRIWVLFRQELGKSATNFFLVIAIVMPLVLTLLVTLVFGDLFSSTPRLGIYDEGESRLESILSSENQLRTTLYKSEDALRASVEQGVNEAGLILPSGFDTAVQSGSELDVTSLVWGEAPERSRLIMDSTVAKAVQQIVGAKTPVTIQGIQLGDTQTVSLTTRLLPLIVLLTIIVGGVMVPAASLVNEKQKHTLNALTITPATLAEIYIAKALLGVSVSMMMGIIVLVLNSAFGSQPGLLVATLALGAVASSVFGVLLGSLVKDINVLLATLKSGGIILFGPAIIQLIPSIPQWIAHLFPTYYIMDPVLQVSQNGAGFGDIAGELAILLAIIAVMLLLLANVIERQQRRLALVN